MTGNGTSEHTPRRKSADRNLFAGFLLLLAGLSIEPHILEILLGTEGFPLKVSWTLGILCIIGIGLGGYLMLREFSRNKPRPAALAAGPLVFAVTLLVTLIVVEIVLRVVHPIAQAGYSDLDRAQIYGWCYPADQEVEAKDPDTNQIIKKKTNSMGYFDIDHEIEKADGVTRILILGDSVVAGFGLPVEAIVGRQLEKELNRRGHDADVISMGVYGWSTDQELLALMRDGLIYKPDVVIVSFVLLNDFVGNLYDHAMFTIKPKPAFRLSENGELVWPFALEKSFRFVRLKRFFANFQIVRHLRFYGVQLLGSRLRSSEDHGLPPDHLTACNPRKKEPTDRIRHDLTGRQDDPLHDCSHYSGAIFPQSPRMVYAWDLTMRLMQEMQSRSEGTGARFLLVEPVADYFLEAEEETGLVFKDGYVMEYDPGRAFEQLRRMCEEAGLDYCFPPLDYPKAKFRNDAHLTREGTAAYARLIADCLEQLGGVFTVSDPDRDEG